MQNKNILSEIKRIADDQLKNTKNVSLDYEITYNKFIDYNKHMNFLQKMLLKLPIIKSHINYLTLLQEKKIRSEVNNHHLSKIKSLEKQMIEVALNFDKNT